MDTLEHRLTQRQLGPNLFEVEYAKRIFLVVPYPFKVVEIDRNIRDIEELSPEINLILADDGCEETRPQYSGFGAVEFITTTHCNLRCTHCTARAFDTAEGNQEYYGMPPEHMSRETMFAVIASGIAQLAKRLEVHPVRVPNFEMFITGGEPLLVWKDLREALSFARTQLAKLPNTDGFVFVPHIVTNGVLITDAMAKELVQHNTHVTVALDSPFNQVRVDLKGNAATPDAILGLKRLVSAGHQNASVNVVIAGEDMGKVDLVMEYLEKLEAFKGITTIQLSPLAPPIAHTAYANKGLIQRKSGFNNQSVCDQFSEKLIEYSKRFGMDFKGYGLKLGNWMLQGGSTYRCPVAEWKWAATPSGDIYACHQLVGIEQFKMGNISNPSWYDSTQAKMVRERFLARTVDKADLCKSCVLKSTCMVFVDCPARSFLEMGSEDRVTPHYCRCGKTYLETLLGEQLLHLIDTGKISSKPLGNVI